MEGEQLAPLYLVTGGCGFIGRKLVDALKQGMQRVRVLDRKVRNASRRRESRV